MSRYTEITEKFGTQVLDAVKPVEELVVLATNAVDGIVTKVRSLPLVEKLPAAPFADRLPTAAEVVEANYALAERLLAAQKDFALRIVAPAPAPAVVVPEQVTKAKTAGSVKV